MRSSRDSGSVRPQYNIYMTRNSLLKGRLFFMPLERRKAYGYKRKEADPHGTEGAGR